MVFPLAMLSATTILFQDSSETVALIARLEDSAFSLDTVRDERTMDTEWKAAHPAILGALLDATSQALRDLEAVDLSGKSPRMADAARWVVASGAVPGFIELYADNRADAIDAEMEASAFASAVLDLVADVGDWKGTAADLLQLLDDRTGFDKPKDWPTNANRCSAALKRHAPALRTRSIDAKQAKSNGKRLWTITGERTTGGLDV